MINLCEKEYCTGCEACVNICPQKCILMERDKEGFDYPVINHARCIGCKKCQKACPELTHLKVSREEFKQGIYAVITKDKTVLHKSASGAAFYELAKYTLDHDGVVFGVAYNDRLQAVHMPIFKIEELSKVQGTKYVQSTIGETYTLVRECLKQKKKVLFSGTPCQIAGLYGYLGEDNSNLLTCDLLCKGVPSPGLFEKYIQHLQRKQNSVIRNIDFRNKKHGWGLLSVSTDSQRNERELKGIDDTFIRTSGMGLVRKSCFECKYTCRERVGDITLGDFWHIGEKREYSRDSSQGCSVVLLNTKKGNDLLKEIEEKIELDERLFEEVLEGQSSSLTKPIKKPDFREQFFVDAGRIPYETLAKKYLLDKSIKGRIRRVIPRKIDKYITEIVKKRKITRGK